MNGRIMVTAVTCFALLAAFAAAIAFGLFLAGASFANPPWLWIAAGAPVVLALDALARAWRRRSLRRLGNEVAVTRLVEGRAVGVRALRALLASCAVLLLGVACARPQWGFAEEQVRRKGVDVLIAVDTSRSMLAEDVKPDRISRARLEIASLIDRLAGDRVGLIAFAGDARVLCPLTLDHGAANLFLDLLEPGVVDRPGTAVAPSLELALKSFPKESARHSVVILITDGEDHEGGAIDAAKELAAAGVIVHTVGIGRPEGGPIPIDEVDDGGRRVVSYLKDEKGNAVMSRLDVEMLKDIARTTGGMFYQASSSDLDLTAIAAAIAGMEQQDLGSQTSRNRPDRAAWFLAAALALLAVEAFLPDGAPLFAGRRAPRTSRSQGKQGLGRGSRVAEAA